MDFKAAYERFCAIQNESKEIRKSLDKKATEIAVLKSTLDNEGHVPQFDYARIKYNQGEEIHVEFITRDPGSGYDEAEEEVYFDRSLLWSDDAATTLREKAAELEAEVKEAKARERARYEEAEKEKRKARFEELRREFDTK